MIALRRVEAVMSLSILTAAKLILAKTDHLFRVVLFHLPNVLTSFSAINMSIRLRLSRLNAPDIHLTWPFCNFKRSESVCFNTFLFSVVSFLTNRRVALIFCGYWLKYLQCFFAKENHQSRRRLFGQFYLMSPFFCLIAIYAESSCPFDHAWERH